jgi:DNA-binding transcriptional LysR family regulator
MTDTQINCFLLLAEQMNFTRAAEELGIAQSTLSAHISALEEDLDLRLFIRTKRKVFLSPEGEIMRETFKIIQQQLIKGLEEAHNLHDQHSAVLRIGFMQGLDFSIVLNKIFEDFRNIYPNAKLEVYRMNNNDLIDGLGAFTLDVVFTLERILNLRPHLIGTIVYETPLSIVYFKESIKKSAGELTLQDFQNQKFVVLSKNIDSTEYDFLMSICEKLNLKPKTIVEVSSVESQFLNVEFGMGMALSNHLSRLYGNPKFSFMDIPNMATKVVAIFKKKHPNPMVSLFQNICSRMKG